MNLLTSLAALWRERTPLEIACRQLTTAQGDLLYSEAAAEHHFHTAEMLRTRIDRLRAHIRELSQETT